jgi:ribonuclease HI
VLEEQINCTRPWDFFDGASQENEDHCGGGGVLYISPSHFYKLKWGLGQGSNNYVELMVLKILLTFAGEKWISNLQIFGDSMMVINWSRKTQMCHNTILSPILDEVFLIANLFTNMSFQHVYRESNVATDSLCKEGTLMALRQWYVIDYLDGHGFEHYHMPFIEQTRQ